MPRLKHHFEEGYPYLVTFVVNGRLPIFTSKGAAEAFLSALCKCHAKLGFTLLAFVVMPDHVHLILVPNAPWDITAVVRQTKGLSASTLHEALSKRGKVWQTSFFDTALRTDRSLLEAIEYVHKNPVAANLASAADTYPYSSANAAYPIDLDDWLSGGNKIPALQGTSDGKR